MAASLLVALGWIASQRFVSDLKPTLAAEVETIGIVADLDDVQWAEGATQLLELAQLPIGERIHFTAGVVELLLTSGAEIVIEGPADLTLDSVKKARVDEGKLVVRCGPDAVGFEIESPDAKVVDLGTVFGVSVVDKERTDVIVYDGAVDLSSRGINTPMTRRLTAGEALHVSRHGPMGRIPLVPNERLLLPRTSGAPNGHSALIQEVRDSLQASETAKYYRIVGGGFGEDCLAFVDRDHQWNGVDQEGLPEFLLGGDYVRTFNDDKVREIKIEVDLAAPASLYLILDNRVAIPDWVKADFVDTGWDIGLDEAYDHKELINTAVGTGESVDQVFSVWRRDCLAPTIVRLNSIRSQELELTQDQEADPRKIEQCMYGIVVTELAEVRHEINQ